MHDALTRIGGRLALLGMLAGPAAVAAAESEVVEEGRIVSFRYTLKLDDGTVADTNVGGDPVRYRHGEGRILGGLADALEGMQEDESASFTLAPDQAYGEIDPEAVREVELARIPESAHHAGAVLVANTPAGPRRVRVREVREDIAVIDFNHPLAGETLHFDVRVISIE